MVPYDVGDHFEQNYLFYLGLLLARFLRYCTLGKGTLQRFLCLAALFVRELLCISCIGDFKAHLNKSFLYETMTVFRSPKHNRPAKKILLL